MDQLADNELKLLRFIDSHSPTVGEHSFQVLLKEWDKASDDATRWASSNFTQEGFTQCLEHLKGLDYILVWGDVDGRVGAIRTLGITARGRQYLRRLDARGPAEVLDDWRRRHRVIDWPIFAVGIITIVYEAARFIAAGLGKIIELLHR